MNNKKDFYSIYISDFLGQLVDDTFELAWFSFVARNKAKYFLK